MNEMNEMNELNELSELYNKVNSYILYNLNSMEFSNTTEELLENLFPIIKFSKYSYKNKKLFHNILDQLYKDLLNADRYLNKQIEKECLQKDIQKIISIKQIDNPTMYNSHFFPDDIKAYIHKNCSYFLKYRCKIHNTNLEINFVITELEDINKLHIFDKYVKYVYMWIYIVTLYSKRQLSKNLKVHFYMTPFQKLLPNNERDILNPNNINSGYSTIGSVDGEIVIFRKEEWFKVFVHETFHAFGLDFAGYSQNNINRKIKKLFPINSDFKLFEAYTETWARILNSVFLSFHLIHKNKLIKKEDFYKNCLYCLEIEKYFTMYQCVKVLRYMGLTYPLLYKKDEYSIHIRNVLYTEKTSIFSYYVMSAIFMNNYIDFMDWCNTNNISLLTFNPHHLNGFFDLITILYKKNSFLKKMNTIRSFLDKQEFNQTKSLNNLLTTTRMTILEFE